jgi:hypothetical protein
MEMRRIPRIQRANIWRSIYLNTFTDLHFAQDPLIWNSKRYIAKRIAENTKYISSQEQLQNEVIETLSEIVSETVAMQWM